MFGQKITTMRGLVNIKKIVALGYALKSTVISSFIEMMLTRSFVKMKRIIPG
jgi:hypothetical protein